METLEANGETCDVNHCVCDGRNPVCEYQEWLNDSDRIRDEQMETDDETDAEEGEIDEEMISEESGFAEEVGFLFLIAITTYFYFRLMTDGIKSLYYLQLQNQINITI